MSDSRKDIQTKFAKLIGNETFDVEKYEETKNENVQTDNGSSKFFEKREHLNSIAENTEFMNCPSCKVGQLKLKVSRYETLFVACTNFP